MQEQRINWSSQLRGLLAIIGEPDIIYKTDNILIKKKVPDLMGLLIPVIEIVSKFRFTSDKTKYGIKVGLSLN